MMTSPTLTPDDPILDMSRWPWPYGPFLMTDADGNLWKLSARDPWSNGNTARLICATAAEIDGTTYMIVGEQLLNADGMPIAEPQRTQIFPPPAESSNPDRVMRRSLAIVRKAMRGPEASDAFGRAVAVARLPLAERMKVDEQTRLALASRDEIERRIASLKDDLRPGGGEDQATARLIADLAAIRVNGSRKRERIERLAEELHNRTGYRAKKKESLRLYEARLAELRRLEAGQEGADE